MESVELVYSGGRRKTIGMGVKINPGSITVDETKASIIVLGFLVLGSSILIFYNSSDWSESVPLKFK